MTINNGWTRKRLGEFADVISGYAFKSNEFKAAGVPVIKIKNIRVGSVDLKDAECVDEKFLSLPKKYHVRNGDVLISLTGSHISQPNSVVGRVARFSSEFGECLLNQRAGKIILKNQNDCDPRFLFYVLGESATVKSIALKAHGAASQANVSPGQVESVELFVPPFPLQQRIAVILSAYDDLIEINLRRIKILEEMARSLYCEWFVYSRYPGHESVPLGSSSLGPIPEGWVIKPVIELAEYRNGFAFKPSHLGTSGKPVVKIRELKAGVTSDTPRNSGEDIPEKFNVSDGDVLFSWSADLDTYLWYGGESLLNQHLFKVIPKNGFSRNFCYHTLKEVMAKFRSLSLGSTMQHIKRSALDQVFVVIPSQTLRIKFDNLTDPVHKRLLLLHKQNQNLKETRNLLLPRLLSGQIHLNGKVPAA